MFKKHPHSSGDKRRAILQWGTILRRVTRPSYAKKISVLRLSLYNPNNRTASTFYNTQSSYD